MLVFYAKYKNVFFYTYLSFEHLILVCYRAGDDDKECLLLNDYERKAHSSLQSPGSESESEMNLSPTTEIETETSDTDVDAVVEEYKDNIEVKLTLVRRTKKFGKSGLKLVRLLA